MDFDEVLMRENSGQRNRCSASDQLGALSRVIEHETIQAIQIVLHVCIDGLAARGSIGRRQCQVGDE